MLTVENVSKSYGGIQALQDVSFRCEAGASLGLVGANGAGKTTLLNIISGFEKPDSGLVSLGDKVLTERSPHMVAQAGIARTFQKPRIFGNLTVYDNLRLALSSPLAVSGGSSYLVNSASIDGALERIGLNGQGHVLAGELSYGQQKLLELTRTWLCRPRVMLFDEPSAGVHMSLLPIIKDLIDSLRSKGSAVLIVEHDITFMLTTVSQVAIMSQGKLIDQFSGDNLNECSIKNRMMA